MENSESIESLKSHISTELDLCDSSTTPWVCLMKDENYDKVEQLIIDRVTDGGHTISSAIGDIERDYNQDFTND